MPDSIESDVSISSQLPKKKPTRTSVQNPTVSLKSHDFKKNPRLVTTAWGSLTNTSVPRGSLGYWAAPHAASHRACR